MLRFLVTANANVGAEDADVTSVDAEAHVLVVHSREDIQIARGVKQVLGGARKG